MNSLASANGPSITLNSPRDSWTRAPAALGARPAVTHLRRRLRELGVVRMPRRPNVTTRRNPVGLTVRQIEILGLLAQGLSNAEIAERLVVSTRTIDHHVAAVFQRLDVHSRRDAAAMFDSLGLAD